VSAVHSLDLASLRTGYADGSITPGEVIRAVYDRIERRGPDAAWITVASRESALAAARDLEQRFPAPASRPALYGIPFAVKDNIDAAGLPTTAAYPPLSAVPDASAELVTRLIDAGAILVGKTNLDQLATGLNGTRSPYGTPVNPFDSTRIPGGSSSGSGVVVSAGLVTFAIGTDTAGSGRVPAALNGVVGLKPSRGLVSTTGVLPACPSLDCPSVFALTIADGAAVLAVIAGPDPSDPWSRVFPVPSARPVPRALAGLRLAIPADEDLDFQGDAQYTKAWLQVLTELRAAGVELIPIDLGPFLEAGRMLYGGAWVAERYGAITSLITGLEDALDPAVRAAIEPGRTMDAVRVFADQDRMQMLRRESAQVLGAYDALMTPTVPTAYTVEQVERSPVQLNANLGRYTTFGNLLDLAAVALPAAIAGNGMPFGVTLNGVAGTDGALAAIAASIEDLVDLPMGATGVRRPKTASLGRTRRLMPAPLDPVLVTVVGAHLDGMALNEDLVVLGAELVARTSTAPQYRLFALANTSPPKPGLMRAPEGGEAIAVEVYRMSVQAVGQLMTTVPSPLGIGTVELADGSTTLGFICEPYALDDGVDITGFGGWRSYVAASQ
jgi:allophanate hydrolase